MFFHVFLFTWRPDVSAEQKQRVAEAIRAFQGQIPGLLTTVAGENLSPRGGTYTFGGVMQFETRAACEAYTTHPAHEALLDWLLPLISPLELDLQG